MLSPLKFEVLSAARVTRIAQRNQKCLSYVITGSEQELWRARDQRETQYWKGQRKKQEQEREESSLLPELSHLQIVVHLTEDLLSRASMTVVNGRPTLTINISTAREHWLEGMLRHEIGTSMTSVLQPKGSTCMHSYWFFNERPGTVHIQEGGTSLSKEPIL